MGAARAARRAKEVTPVTIEEALVRRMACAADECAPVIWRDVGDVVPELRADVVTDVERTLEELDEAAHLEPLSDAAEAILQRAANHVLGVYRLTRTKYLRVLLGTTTVPASDPARAAREKSTHLEALRRIDDERIRARVLVDTLRANVAPRHAVTVFELDHDANVDAGPAGLRLTTPTMDREEVGGTVPWAAIYAICTTQDGAPITSRVWPQAAPLSVLESLNHADGFSPLGGVDPPTEH